MLHLAQVNKNPTSGDTELQLLAHQRPDHSWGVSNLKPVPFKKKHRWHEGLLVLVELGEHQQVLTIKEAKDWIVGLIQKYLTPDTITPEWVQAEQVRVEQWRQEITAQSLDLTRRHLELETQREQLQALETNLKKEKEQLETHWQELRDLETSLLRELKVNLKPEKAGEG
jgi:hypothetical protein